MTTTTTRPGPIHPLLRGGEDYPFVKLDKRVKALTPPGIVPINFSIGSLTSFSNNPRRASNQTRSLFRFNPRKNFNASGEK